MNKTEFIKWILPHAIHTESAKHIHHLAIMTQAALESGWGKHAPGNNFFGIKATKNTPENKRQLLQTVEYLSTPDKIFPVVISIEPKNGKYKYTVKDWFRKYDSPEECFSDHADLFYRVKRYSKALEVSNDALLFLEEITKAGYATDPNYYKKLESVANEIQSIVFDMKLEN